MSWPPDFMECPTCAAKPGSPPLCNACLHNREAISRLQNAARIQWEAGFTAGYRARREYETIPEWKRQRMREELNYEPAGPSYRWEDAHPGGLK